MALAFARIRPLMLTFHVSAKAANRQKKFSHMICVTHILERFPRKLTFSCLLSQIALIKREIGNRYLELDENTKLILSCKAYRGRKIP